MKYKNTVYIALGTLGLLLIPLVVSLFTSEMNWSLSDYVIMGAMIFITGLLIDFVMRKKDKYRIVGALVIVFLFLWLWTELAVGIFTNWGS